MSVAQFALAQASLAEIAPTQDSKKPPPRRVVKALGDGKLAPEAR